VRRLHGHREGAGDSLLHHAGEVGGGREITTLEGLGTIEKPHPLQQAFIDEQAAQCGFCLNGVIMTAKAFLDKNPKATSGDPAGAVHRALPLLHARADAARHPAVCEGDGAMKSRAMTS
jgi:aerobic-type carbon monoxide dehydrogenase small subunit (CoxS/CutS family)